MPKYSYSLTTQNKEQIQELRKILRTLKDECHRGYMDIILDVMRPYIYINKEEKAQEYSAREEYFKLYNKLRPENRPNNHK